jgi:hypothetical protein
MHHKGCRRGQRWFALPSFVLAVALTLAACGDWTSPVVVRLAGTIYDVVSIGGQPLPDSGDIMLPPDSVATGHINGGMVVFGDLSLLFETKFKANGDTQTYYRQVSGNYGQVGDTVVFRFARWAIRRGDTLILRPEASPDISWWLSGKEWRLVKRLPQ